MPDSPSILPPESEKETTPDHADNPAEDSSAAPQPLPPAPPVRIANYGRVLALAAALYLALQFFDTITKTLMLFLVSFLIAIVLNGPVRWLEKRGVSRAVSAACVALFALGSLVLIGVFAGPPLADEAAQLAQAAPDQFAQLQQRVESLAHNYPFLQQVLDQSDLSSGGAFQRIAALLPRLGRYTLGIVGGIVTVLIGFVVALYTVAVPRPLIQGLLTAVPPAYRDTTARALSRILSQLESWAVATLILMAIVGTACGLGLWAIGVPNAVLFGVIAGIGEGIPTIGPILSAVPPLVTALAADPHKAIWVALLFLIVQQVENNLLVPFIMGRSLSLHPVSILFFVLALGALLGLPGALLAVPTAIIVKVLFEEFYVSRRPKDQDELDRQTERILHAQVTDD